MDKISSVFLFYIYKFVCKFLCQFIILLTKFLHARILWSIIVPTFLISKIIYTKIICIYSIGLIFSFIFACFKKHLHDLNVKYCVCSKSNFFPPICVISYIFDQSSFFKHFTYFESWHFMFLFFNIKIENIQQHSHCFNFFIVVKIRILFKQEKMNVKYIEKMCQQDTN